MATSSNVRSNGVHGDVNVETSDDLRILLPSFRKYWHLAALTIVTSLLAAVFEGASVGMLVPFLQTFTEDGETFQTGVMWIDQNILQVDAPEVTRMYYICGLIFVATWMRAVFGYFSSVFGIVSRARMVEDLRMRVVDQLQAVALSFYSTRKTGDLINSIMTEIGRSIGSLAILVTVVQRALLLLIYAGLMLALSWQLSLVTFFLFGVLYLSLSSLIVRIQESGSRVTEASSQFTAAISEFISGVRTTIAYNRQPYERANLHDTAERLADSYIEATKRQQLIQPLSQAVVGTVLIAIILVAVQYLVLPGELEMAYLLTFLFAMLRMMPIVHQLNSERGNWAQNRAGLSNVASLLRQDDKPYLPDGEREAPPLREEIAFDRVDFAYEADQMVLKNINLSIKQGKMTAIVGASGAGKSTLVDLIPRLYDPTGGRVLWDGTDVRDFRVRSLRDKIAVVSQSTYIYNTSVRENIAYGDLNAGMDSIRLAAEQANALDFIEELGNGFDTVLGDQGVRLSGGQRQRLAIARAVLKDPDILILDEATSDLDSVSEKLVQESLESLMRGRTVIAIAHRLSTIENADWVVVLENGRIVEEGTYADLIGRKEHLWKYHSIQFQQA
ncbi:MAG: ATP-binding cassette domain-containing protein [Bacteroidetes bacterium]|nr:ATP-binding cassette domain-containing protein [Bacteroidota bacterium]